MYPEPDLQPPTGCPSSDTRTKSGTSDTVCNLLPRRRGSFLSFPLLQDDIRSAIVTGDGCHVCPARLVLHSKETVMHPRINYNQHSPDLIKKLLELSQRNAETLDRTLIDLVHIRASQINGCAFCLDMHIKEAKIHGEGELRLYHVSIWRESPLFTAKERAVLEWTEAVTKIAVNDVQDELFDRVRKELSEKELADLTFAIGTINFWNRLNVSF